MDAVRVAALRELLSGTAWLEEPLAFARSLRTSVERCPRPGGGLLLVGTAEYEPWHLAAHLDDEAAWSAVPALSPVLVRRAVPAGAPAHLSVGLARLEAARRGETLLVVTPEAADDVLLERLHDARRSGATVLALDGGDRELHALAHESLAVAAVRPDAALDFETVQHLVGAAAGESTAGGPRRGRLRDLLSRLGERLTAAPPAPW